MNAIEVNGVTLTLPDLANADDTDRVFGALQKVADGANGADIGQATTYGDQIRAHCRLVFECFNTVFGEGTDTKVFGGNCNLRLALESFETLGAGVRDAYQELSGEVSAMRSRYSPNRSERRSRR